MSPDDYRYLYCVQEYGVEEVILESPEKMSCFLLVLMNAILQGFGAINEVDLRD